MEKCYLSTDGTKIMWESNTMAMWQSVILYKYGDKCNKDYVHLSINLHAHPANNHIRPTNADYRIDLRPVFAPLDNAPYPPNLRAEMVYNSKPRGYGGNTAPDKIIVCGLRGAIATTFYPPKSNETTRLILADLAKRG